jgi:predicted RNase H-like HicB family nuclease
VIEKEYTYEYSIKWSPEDQEFIGTCKEFPSLSHLGSTPTLALLGIITLVKESAPVDQGKEKETSSYIFKSCLRELKYGISRIKVKDGISIHWSVAFFLACCGIWVVSGGYHWKLNLTLRKKNWYGMGRYLASGSTYKSKVRTSPTFLPSSFKYHKDRGWKIDIETNKEMIKSWLTR